MVNTVLSEPVAPPRVEPLADAASTDRTDNAKDTAKDTARTVTRGIVGIEDYLAHINNPGSFTRKMVTPTHKRFAKSQKQRGRCYRSRTRKTHNIPMSKRVSQRQTQYPAKK